MEVGGRAGELEKGRARSKEGMPKVPSTSGGDLYPLMIQLSMHDVP